jgi:hypothetical protein
MFVADGYVPLGPDSNLLPSYNSDTGSWELKIASKVAANKANVRSAAARTDSNIGGVNAASAAAPFAPALTAKQQQVVVAKAQKAVQAASTEAPWYPYECVPCPPGFSVDFYGLTCGESFELHGSGQLFCWCAGELVAAGRLTAIFI